LQGYFLHCIELNEMNAESAWWMLELFFSVNKVRLLFGSAAGCRAVRITGTEMNSKLGSPPSYRSQKSSIGLWEWYLTVNCL
jgi:hypothetical protein